MQYPSGNILRARKNKNDYLKCVVNHEEEELMQVGNKLLQKSVHLDNDPHHVV